ncbi:MAG: hypothetical protein JKY11_08845 [Alphaproteobacteria bacterium]|nr:hypothetical protein [Alphaproteobacteria bacterium]
MRCSLLLSISTLALIASPAYAVDLSDAKAQELKTTLDQFMKNYTAMSTPDMGYELDGEVTVTPANGYFKAALPSLKYKGSDGSYFDIGKIAINAIPTDKQGEWKMALSIPSTMTQYAPDKTPLTTITIGKQKFGGIFHKDLNTFSKLTASYNNVIIKDLDENVTVSIPSATFVHNMEETSAGFFSGPSEYKISNLSIKKDGQAFISADKISMNAKIENFDMSVISNIQDKTKDMMGSTDGAMHQVPNPEVIFGILSDVYFKSSDSFSINFKAENLMMNKPNDEDQLIAGDEVKISNIHFGLGMNGLRKEKSTIDLSFGYTVPANQIPTEAGLNALIPNNTNISISFKDLPLKKMVQMGEDSVGQGENAGNSLKMQAMMNLPQMLTASGAQIEIKDLSLSGKDYGAKVTGSALANTQAAMQATATINGELTGLGTILTSLNALTGPEARMARQLIGPLTMLQMMGQQKGEGDIRTYNFQLTEGGNMTLNGSDLSALMGSGKHSAGQ